MPRATACLLALLCVVGCKSPANVGSWESSDDGHSARLTLRPDGTFTLVAHSPSSKDVTVRSDGTYGWLGDRVSLNIGSRIVVSGNPEDAAKTVRRIGKSNEPEWLRRLSGDDLELLSKASTKAMNDVQKVTLRPSRDPLPSSPTEAEKAFNQAAIAASLPKPRSATLGSTPKAGSVDNGMPSPGTPPAPNDSSSSGWPSGSMSGATDSSPQPGEGQPSSADQ